MGANENSYIKKETSGWTLYLLLNCLAACLGSFQFGFNIGVTNLPTPIIKKFYLQDKELFLNNANATFQEKKALYEEKMAAYLDGLKKYEDGERRYKEGIEKVNLAKKLLAEYENTNETAYDIVYQKALDTNLNYTQLYGMTVEDYLKDARFKLNVANKTLTNATNLLREGKMKLDDGQRKIEEGPKKIEFFRDLLWTITNCLFVVGGMIGAFCSKPLSDCTGRRMSIILHNIFSLLGALSVMAIYLLPNFEQNFSFVMISRLLYGIQGGMACTLIPTYLNEISPPNLRGATGCIGQLFVTVGIMLSQFSGFRQLLGTEEQWINLLSLPAIPAIICFLSMFLFFAETPASLVKKNQKEYATRTLKKLRHSSNVEEEMERIEMEAKGAMKDGESITFMQLINSRELRRPLITCLVIQITQQLCGINAIFFYSERIFKKSGIEDSAIQYCISLTGVINVISTLIAIPLLDKLGRRALLVYPMAIIVFDYILLTVFLNLQHLSSIYSYLCILCIILFIICFAVGLGPIPFVYVAECFGPNSRSAAIAICMFTNWTANLLLTLAFPFLNDFLKSYVFLVFSVIVLLAGIFITKNMPESKYRSSEDILNEFNKSSLMKERDESDKKLMQLGSP